MPRSLRFRNDDGSRSDVELVTLNPAIIQAYATATNISPVCERCKTNSWDVVADGGPNLGRLPIIDMESMKESGTVAAFILSCQNCGNIWMIATRRLLDWYHSLPVDQRPSMEDNNG